MTTIKVRRVADIRYIQKNNYNDVIYDYELEDGVDMVIIQSRALCIVIGCELFPEYVGKRAHVQTIEGENRTFFQEVVIK